MTRLTVEEFQEHEERKRQMDKLRKKGMSYQQIAWEFGVSKQRVFQIIGGSKENHFRPFNKERCIYVGLRKWLNDNKVSLNELTRKLHGNTNSNNRQRTRARIIGEVEIEKTFIDKILEITGLTYEKAFETEGDT